MDQIRAEKFEQLINLLDRADALQQQLLGDTDAATCYVIHQALSRVIDDVEMCAADEEKAAEING
jgi:hypothetical protein